MKHALLAAAAFIAMNASGVALAADLPVKAPVYKAPVVAPLYNWTGFYIGANLGGSFGHSSTDWTVAGTPASTSHDMNGILGGFQAGYNWQTGSWVWGLEADIQATGQKGSSSLSHTYNLCAVAPCPVTNTMTLENKLPWFGTFRGRVGFTPADRWLVYATGGLAYGDVKTNLTTTLTTGAGATESASTTKTGWTVGAGVETAFAANWTVKVEYLYMDLGSAGNTFTGIAPLTPVVTSSHVTDNIVRAGLNYRF